MGVGRDGGERGGYREGGQDCAQGAEEECRQSRTRAAADRGGEGGV